MIGDVLARRYSLAIFRAARDANAVEPVYNELTSLAELMTTRKEFKYFMLTPRIGKNRKIKLFQDTFGNRFHQLTLNFIAIIIEKRRQEFLRKIASYFKILYDIHYGLIDASITSAIKLSGDEDKEIENLIDRITNRKAVLSKTVDQKILGGLIIQIGNTIFDASLKSQLVELRKKLHE